MILRVAALIAAVLASGCSGATIAEKRYDEWKLLTQSANAKYEQCLNDLAQTDDYAFLQSVTAKLQPIPGLGGYEKDRTPFPEEQPYIGRMGGAWIDCDLQLSADYSALDVQWGETMRLVSERRREIILQLYNRQITYGDANALLDDLNDAKRTTLMKRDEKLREGFAASHNSEIANRQAKAAWRSQMMIGLGTALMQSGAQAPAAQSHTHRDFVGTRTSCWETLTGRIECTTY